MPGLLTSIFEDDANPTPSVEPMPAEDGSGEPIDGDAIEAGISLDQGLALDVGLSNEMGGTYQSLDGSETTWSREDSLDLNLDTSVLLSADGSAEG